MTLPVSLALKRQRIGKCTATATNEDIERVCPGVGELWGAMVRGDDSCAGELTSFPLPSAAPATPILLTSSSGLGSDPPAPSSGDDIAAGAPPARLGPSPDRRVQGHPRHHTVELLVFDPGLGSAAASAPNCAGSAGVRRAVAHGQR